MATDRVSKLIPEINLSHTFSKVPVKPILSFLKFGLHIFLCQKIAVSVLTFELSEAKTQN